MYDTYKYVYIKWTFLSFIIKLYTRIKQKSWSKSRNKEKRPRLTILTGRIHICKWLQSHKYIHSRQTRIPQTNIFSKLDWNYIWSASSRLINFEFCGRSFHKSLHLNVWSVCVFLRLNFWQRLNISHTQIISPVYYRPVVVIDQNLLTALVQMTTSQVHPLCLQSSLSFKCIINSKKLCATSKGINT